jgi:hypothetical protein
MPKARIPLVGSIVNRNINPATFENYDQLFTNCYPEIVKNGVTGKTQVFLNKRPGFVSVTGGGASSAGNPGACMWNPIPGTMANVNSYATATTVKIKSSTLGVVDFTIASNTFCRYIGDTDVSGTPNLVMLVSADSSSINNAYFYPYLGAITEITNVNYPSKQTPALTTVGDPVFMDGYMFIMTSDAKIWNSDLNSLANWSANSFITAGSIPDLGVGLARLKNTIYAFGTKSIEVFVNGGNPSGSPLTRVGSGMKHIGAYFGFNGLTQNGYRTILKVGEFIYFISVIPEVGTMGIHRIGSDGQLEKVSNGFIDKLLFSFGSAVYMNLVGSFSAHGMTHIIFSFFTIPLTYCFCQETGVWWSFSSSGIGAPTSAIGAGSSARFITSLGSSLLFKNNSSDALSQTYQDDSVAYTMSVRTGRIDFDTENRKICHKFELIGDKRSTSGNTGIAWSDDDYTTTTTARNVDMSTVRPRLNRLGSFRRRSFTITDAVNAPFRAEAMTIDYEECSS